MSETNDRLAHACELVGRFFYHFSRMELQLDTAIAKLFKLDPLYAPIVTANIAEATARFEKAKAKAERDRVAQVLEQEADDVEKGSLG
jgi:hypothetical protein